MARVYSSKRFVTSLIAVLPAHVADQIAAGEVIERPFSVVKELVENSLDAGATVITIDASEGGRAIIRVADDGSGMSPSDARLALARHATSKLRTAEDLVGVRSFGFRGEALPAIASVSAVVIESADTDGGGGVRVEVAGGAVVAEQAIARARGTTVTVSRLFYNAPARLRFVRSARAEWRAIVEWVQGIAALRRDVRFVLRHDGRDVLDLPAAASLRARLGALWGHHEIDRFVVMPSAHGTIGVEGLVERPAVVGTAARRTLVMINQRIVRDFGMLRAAEAGYRSTLPAGMRPSVVLDIRVPPDDVDVNVHPTKAEVRLRDRWGVERAVEYAVQRALGITEASTDFDWRWRGAPGASVADVWPPRSTELTPDALRRGGAPRPEGLFAVGAAVLETPIDGETVVSTAAVASPPSAPDDIIVPPLWQLRATYLLFEHHDGLVLIDQHSAHERVLYEQFLQTLTRGEAPSQRLLFPLTLHLSAAEFDAFEANAAQLTLLGFEAEPFGGHALLVHAVPLPHPRFDAERCLRETLSALSGDRVASDAAKHERLAATVACKAAIKAGDLLSPGEMRALYIALAGTRLAPHDVHGRSTIVRLSWDDVDRRFGRR